MSEERNARGETLAQAWARGLDLWTVYDHPRDFPGEFIARRWNVGTDEDGQPQTTATAEVVRSPDLEVVRHELARRGLVRLQRNVEDDDRILETWL